ncbi:unnamed protein product [Acanthosepion pharaonis]|uniref:Uncharacterized protein n=1 Tax=Acanthosepion pharaonis TaxID=158019 RepID=A0A812EHT4_ACAPH|nr:unnamed protein product [Sepia pharaonis]
MSLLFGSDLALIRLCPSLFGSDRLSLLSIRLCPSLFGSDGHPSLFRLCPSLFGSDGHYSCFSLFDYVPHSLALIDINPASLYSMPFLNTWSLLFLVPGRFCPSIFIPGRCYHCLTLFDAVPHSLALIDITSACLHSMLFVLDRRYPLFVAVQCPYTHFISDRRYSLSLFDGVPLFLDSTIFLLDFLRRRYSLFGPDRLYSYLPLFEGAPHHLTLIDTTLACLCSMLQTLLQLCSLLFLPPDAVLNLCPILFLKAGCRRLYSSLFLPGVPHPFLQTESFCLCRNLTLRPNLSLFQYSLAFFAFVRCCPSHSVAAEVNTPPHCLSLYDTVPHIFFFRQTLLPSLRRNPTLFLVVFPDVWPLKALIVTICFRTIPLLKQTLFLSCSPNSVVIRHVFSIPTLFLNLSLTRYSSYAVAVNLSHHSLLRFCQSPTLFSIVCPFPERFPVVCFCPLLLLNSLSLKVLIPHSVCSRCLSQLVAVTRFISLALTLLFFTSITLPVVRLCPTFIVSCDVVLRLFSIFDSPIVCMQRQSGLLSLSEIVPKLFFFFSFSPSLPSEADLHVSFRYCSSLIVSIRR